MAKIRGALPSIPLRFSLATILLPEPKNFDFSQGANEVVNQHSMIPSWLKTALVAHPNQVSIQRFHKVNGLAKRTLSGCLAFLPSNLSWSSPASDSCYLDGWQDLFRANNNIRMKIIDFFSKFCVFLIFLAHRIPFLNYSDDSASRRLRESKWLPGFSNHPFFLISPLWKFKMFSKFMCPYHFD